VKVAKINTPVADDLSSTLTSFTQNMAIEDTQVWPLSDKNIITQKLVPYGDCRSTSNCQQNVAETYQNYQKQ